MAVAIIAVAFSGTVAPSAAPMTSGTGGGYPGPGGGLPGHLPGDHIQHVITVMMENHVYDSFFGTYCQVLGPFCSMTANGIPSGTCIPYYPAQPSYGCVAPFNFTPAGLTIPDMEHDWYSGPLAYDHGAMDGFYNAEGTTNTFGHYNQTTIPIYWDMAEQYGMGDNFWGSNLSYSLPNHWYMVAGASPPFAYNGVPWYSNLQQTYLDQSNNTTTVEDLLNHSSVSWKYYDYSLLPYSQAIAGGGWGSAYDLWNPMAARAESYSANLSGHFVDRLNLVSDLQLGTLPNVSWVIPDPGYSDHPGYNLSAGESWVAQLVNAVASSSYWNSTVIFVTWDDYGGWYDHVAPPTILGDQLSFRAPVLVISPYAKENYVSHTFLTFVSLLHFIEWQFGLGCLRPMDCFAPLPLDFFNFNQPPRAPIIFHTSWTSATYPMPLQANGASAIWCSGCLGVNDRTWVGAPAPEPNPLVMDLN
jgi:phospholipase C